MLMRNWSIRCNQVIATATRNANWVQGRLLLVIGTRSSSGTMYEYRREAPALWCCLSRTSKHTLCLCCRCRVGPAWPPCWMICLLICLQCMTLSSKEYVNNQQVDANWCLSIATTTTNIRIAREWNAYSPWVAIIFPQWWYSCVSRLDDLQYKESIFSTVRIPVWAEVVGYLSANPWAISTVRIPVWATKYQPYQVR